jgi:hypothetical protein
LVWPNRGGPWECWNAALFEGYNRIPRLEVCHWTLVEGMFPTIQKMRYAMATSKAEIIASSVKLVNNVDFFEPGPEPPKSRPELIVNATVKIKQSGSYVLKAGFYKDGTFHEGEVTGRKFYKEKVITGKDGDTIKIEIRVDDVPPFNTNTHVELFDK